MAQQRMQRIMASAMSTRGERSERASADINAPAAWD
jgi:hypothetical protein